MSTAVESFYDRFSSRYVRDYVLGNLRVDRQLSFFSEAVGRDAATILVVGCGSGESALHLATRVAPRARVLAVDLSAQSVRMARLLCHHPRVEYRQADILADSVGGPWDVIAMPDVYEHIPAAARTILAHRINEILAPKGKLLLTCPAPCARRDRRRAEGKLQIIDEDIRVSDLLELAACIEARLSFYRLISIWNPDDFFHAVIERGSESEAALSAVDKLPLKGWRPKTRLERFWHRLESKLGLKRLRQWRRLQRVAGLGLLDVAAEDSDRDGAD